MQKRRMTFLALALALVLALVLGACGAKGAEGSESFDLSAGGYGTNPAPEKPGEWSGEEAPGLESLTGTQKPTDLSEKMIYTADVTVETMDFEASVRAVEDMVGAYGAFFESTNVSNLSYADRYYGNTVYRTARYVIRVPAQRFTEMTEGLDAVGSVVNLSSRAENITAQFYDTQARRDAYGIEQERLLDMLAKCETVGEMIEIESRLSEVRYQIESLESTLRNWQTEVDYSTVNLTVREVEAYTKREEPHRSYWQQIGDGFMDTVEAVGDFFKTAFKDLVIALPILVPVIAVIAVVLLLVLRSRRRRRARANALDAAFEEEKD